MREFEKRIHAYKAMLPHMRERVMAALAMLVVAAIVMVSASYAWIVLSVNPEVKGINTTITANGNLEIALATGSTITEPADSVVGDGGKNLVLKNVTWGNLINLGDPAYGLDSITLRPAKLNTNDLLASPFYAANYGADGRVEELMSDFAYTYYNYNSSTGTGVFSPLEEFKNYGVRAVSSVAYSFSEGADGKVKAEAAAAVAAEKSITAAAEDLQALAKDDALQDLVGLMAAYVNAQIEEKINIFNPQEPFVDVSVQQLASILELMIELKANMELCADALADVYNYEMLRRTESSYVATNKFTGTYLLTETRANIETKFSATNAAGEVIVQAGKDNGMLPYLWKLREDYNTLLADITVLESYQNRTDVKYRNLRGSEYPVIEPYVTHIVNVQSVKVNGTPIGGLSKDSIGSLTGGGPKPIVIQEGIIQRMDKFTGAGLESNDLTMTVMGSPATGKATTSAAEPFVLPTEFARSKTGVSNYKGDTMQAADTYGLVLDFFVRTNAENTQLILQGSPVYEQRERNKTAEINGVTYTLLTVTVEVTDGQTTEQTEYTAFLKDDNYYSYDEASKTAGTQPICSRSEAKSATVQTETYSVAVDYSGVNRVWEENGNIYLDENSTTKGAGSCYTFYAEALEDQDKFLLLLQNLKIAFIDQNGVKLGEAEMDVKNAAKQTGKVIVPIVCSVTNNSVTGKDGNPLYYITELQANTPTFITALLYLDGSTLSNDQVLAVNDIQGQLNLQFGTTADLNSMNDPMLMEEKCFVTAAMEGNTTASIDDPVADRTKTITVSVDGYEATSVIAYFQQEINSTQGIRQEAITFQKNADGDWVGTHTFDKAGKFVLREVVLDGITYELDHSPIVFTVEGYSVNSLYCEHNNRTFMTTERQFNTAITLNFSSSDAMPDTVKGAFIHTETGNRTTVYFTRTAGSTWVGEAEFTISGTYKMTYLEMDDTPAALSEEQSVSVKLYLGVTVSVYTGDTTFKYEEPFNVDMYMLISADDGSSIGGLSGVWLEYSREGLTDDANTPGAGMVWNNSREMYQGTLRIDNPGIYDYFYTEVYLDGQRNELSTKVAPTITAISTDEAVYVDRAGFGEDVFSLNNDAAFTVTMRRKGAESGTLDAKLTDAAGNLYYVRGVPTVSGDNKVYTFTLPSLGANGQAGTWTLQGVYMTNVNEYVDDITDYLVEYRCSTPADDPNSPNVDSEGKPIYTVVDGYYDANWWYWPADKLTATDSEGNPLSTSVTVVNSIEVQYVSANQEFADLAFGSAPQFGTVQVEVTANGRPLSTYGLSVESITTTYTYQTRYLTASGTENWYNSYGGYTVGRTALNGLLDGNPDIKKIDYKYTTAGTFNGTVYDLITTNTAANMAGVYASDKIVVKLTGLSETTEKVMQAPTITIRSVKPVVQITKAWYEQPVDSFRATLTLVKGTPQTIKTGYNTTASASYSDYSAVLPIMCGRDDTETGTDCDGNVTYEYKLGYVSPKVTLTLSGLNVGSSVLNFSKNTNLYTTLSSTTETLTLKYATAGEGTAYSFGAQGATCTRLIGKNSFTVWRGGHSLSSNGSKTAAGKITADILSTTYNGIEFHFALENPIVIDQAE